MTALAAAIAVGSLVLVLGRRRSPRTRLGVAAAPRPLTGSASTRVVRAGGVGSLFLVTAMGWMAGAPPPLLALPATVAAVMPRWWGRRRQRRLTVRREAESVEVVFALAAELRAGRPPGRALALVADTATVMRSPLYEAAAAVSAGSSPAAELLRIADLPGCAGMRAVAAAWAVTESVGGAIAEVVDRLGDVMDGELQSRATLDATLAGPRATMGLLAALPLLGLALGQALGARPFELLVHRPIGWAMLAAGIFLDAVGVMWTRLLVRHALR